jgi:hypothetical protein
MNTKTCLQCNKIFEKPKHCGFPEWNLKRKFCSHDCYAKSMENVVISAKRREKISKTMIFRGISPKIKWEKGIPSPFVAVNEEHWNWKGGISKEKSYPVLMVNRRRARIKGNGGKHSLEEWEGLKISYGYRCAECSEFEFLQKDHIVPISKGGTDDIWNIQPLCKSCNCKKRAKLPAYQYQYATN